MGAIVSGWFLGSEEDYKVRKAIERELALVAQHTQWEIEELRELHAAFLAQYPTGFISPQQFIDENTEAIGGPPELWQHYFNLLATPPLTRRRSHKSTTSASQASVAAASAAAGGPGGRGNSPPPSAAAAAAAGGGGGGGGTTSAAAGGTGFHPAATGMSSISERLQAANRGMDDKKKMRTSLISTTDPTEDLDLDPRVVGLGFAHVMIRLNRSIVNASEQKLKYLFNFFDINQDGLISLSDLTTTFDWLYQVPLVQQLEGYQELEDAQKDPKVRAETLLRTWDRDGDGLLNQDEFVEMGRADPDLLELLSALRK